MRRALTGVVGEEGVAGFSDAGVLLEVLSAGLSGSFEPELVEPGLLVPVFFEPVLDLGRRRLGLAVLLELAGFSLGREVRNAPRMSSSS